MVNNNHEMSSFLGKSSYIPPDDTFESAIDLYRHYNEIFRFFGEKIAFGPVIPCKSVYSQDKVFDFYSRNFPLTIFYLTLRKPIECIYSMQKMFLDYPVRGLIECWLRTLKLQLNCYNWFSNSYFVFHEDIGPPMLERLATILQIDISLDESWIDKNKARKAYLPDNEIPSDLSEYQDVLTGAGEVYSMLRKNFSPEHLTYAEKKDPAKFFLHIHYQLDELIRKLDFDPESENAEFLNQRALFWTEKDPEILRERDFFKKKSFELSYNGIENIIFYGAGQHTERFMKSAFMHSFRKIYIVDDSPEKHGSTLMSIKIKSPAELPENLSGDNTAVLISSDTYEQELYEKALKWVKPGIKTIKLYDTQISE